MSTFLTDLVADIQRRRNRLRRKAGFAAIGVGVSVLHARRVVAVVTAVVVVLCSVSFAAGVALS